MGLILLVILIFLIILSLPTWPYSRGWGYGPTGLVSLILLVIILLILTNIIGFWRVEVPQDPNAPTTIKIERPQQY